jgi:predicted nuclease of predicted toxin-antitoxin system
LNDVPILRLAWNEGAVILTNDKDLQRHILKDHHRAHSLAWLRLGRTPRALAVERISEVIQAYEQQLLHVLTIIYPDPVEQQPLP